MQPNPSQGFLTGTIDHTTSFESSDVRSWFPRFSEDARQANQPVVDLVRKVAADRDATPAQIALAWLLAQRPWIVPIPGTRRLQRLDENLAAAQLELTEEDLARLDSVTSTVTVHGARGTGRERYS
jgi:aryl-alcohol dehydrogenase-like predicted oxidoreductase